MSEHEQRSQEIPDAIHLPDRVSRLLWLAPLMGCASIMVPLYIAFWHLRGIFFEHPAVIIPFVIVSYFFTTRLVTPFVFPAASFSDSALLSIAAIDGEIHVTRTNGAEDVFALDDLQAEGKETRHFGRHVCLLVLSPKQETARSYYISRNSKELEGIFAFLVAKKNVPGSAQPESANDKQLFAMPTGADTIYWQISISVGIVFLFFPALFYYIGPETVVVTRETRVYGAIFFTSMACLFLWALWMKQNGFYRIVVFKHSLHLVSRSGRRKEYPLDRTSFSFSRGYSQRGGNTIDLCISPFGSDDAQRIRLADLELSLELEALLEKCKRDPGTGS